MPYYISVKILILLFVFLSIQADPPPRVKVILNEIPPKDKIALEQFFKLLIREEAFGYTLFGPKPMSIADFSPPSYRFTDLSKLYVLEKGWEAWLRNQHHFSNDSFILKKEIHKIYGTRMSQI